MQNATTKKTTSTAKRTTTKKTAAYVPPTAGEVLAIDQELRDKAAAIAATSRTIDDEDAAALQLHIAQAIDFADSLVGRAVAVITDPCLCGADDAIDLARMAGRLRNALLAARCCAPSVEVKA